jgi:hypothetical protein
MACLTSPRMGHFWPIFALFRIFKPMKQGDKMYNIKASIKCSQRSGNVCYGKEKSRFNYERLVDLPGDGREIVCRLTFVT